LTKSRLDFKSGGWLLQGKRFRIKLRNGLPTLRPVIEMLNIGDCRPAIYRKRGSYARNCFSKQERVVV